MNDSYYELLIDCTAAMKGEPMTMPDFDQLINKLKSIAQSCRTIGANKAEFSIDEIQQLIDAISTIRAQGYNTGQTKSIG